MSCYAYHESHARMSFTLMREQLNSEMKDLEIYYNHTQKRYATVFPFLSMKPLDLDFPLYQTHVFHSARDVGEKGEAAFIEAYKAHIIYFCLCMCEYTCRSGVSIRCHSSRAIPLFLRQDLSLTLSSSSRLAG